MRNTGSETVLIVDDDPMILNFIKEEIGQYGYRSLLARNADEALTLAANEKVNLLLTDIMMPGTNGIDLARQFVAMHPEIKVLFMSAYLCPSLAHQGIPESEFAFVQKPFAPNMLVKKMRKVLSGPEGLKRLEDYEPA